MELLNFVSWVKKGFVSKTVAPKDLIPLGVRLSDREDSYVTTVITGEDLINSITSAVGSTVGPVGAQGPQGSQGVAGPVGPAGLNWQGAWDTLAVYALDDAVGYAGASWFCINPTGPNLLSPNLDPLNWALLASQGSPGPQGAQGIQGPSGSGSYAFTQVNNSPQYSYPSASPYVADFITIPANTFNATTKAVLGLTASVNKIGTNGLFKIQAYITTTLPVLNTTLITGTRLGGAVTTTIAQRGQKIERDLAINGNSIYYINITDTNDSNSDGAILAANANYNGLLFDTVFSSVPINWTSTVYISLIISSFSPLDLFGARYITVSKK
jgi:hypothetical protein